MPKITKNTLKKHLETLEKEELINEVLRLYEKIKAVKDFYEMDLGTDTNAVLNEYKAKIEKQYFPKRGYGNPKASEVRKVILDFKKIVAVNFPLQYADPLPAMGFRTSETDFCHAGNFNCNGLFTVTENCRFRV